MGHFALLCRCFRFRLRTLMVVVLFSSIGIGLCVREVSVVRRRATLFERLDSLGCYYKVNGGWGQQYVPGMRETFRRWMTKALDTHYQEPVESLLIYADEQRVVMPREMWHENTLKNVELAGRGIEDIEFLSNQTGLRKVCLYRTNVTDLSPLADKEHVELTSSPSATYTGFTAPTIGFPPH